MAIEENSSKLLVQKLVSKDDFRYRQLSILKTEMASIDRYLGLDASEEHEVAVKDLTSRDWRMAIARLTKRATRITWDDFAMEHKLSQGDIVAIVGICIRGECFLFIISTHVPLPEMDVAILSGRRHDEDDAEGGLKRQMRNGKVLIRKLVTELPFSGNLTISKAEAQVIFRFIGRQVPTDKENVSFKDMNGRNWNLEYTPTTKVLHWGTFVDSSQVAEGDVVLVVGYTEGERNILVLMTTRLLLPTFHEMEAVVEKAKCEAAAQAGMQTASQDSQPAARRTGEMVLTSTSVASLKQRIFTGDETVDDLKRELLKADQRIYALEKEGKKFSAAIVASALNYERSIGM